MKKLVLYIFFLFFILKISFLSTGCANIIPPTGGPRDSLPPVLMKAVPVDSARNFTGNKIVLTFDEYVDVEQNEVQNMVVSPTPKINPIIDHKLRTVTIKIRDTLEPNTTYAINFGKAIKDFNEGNVLKNFTYVFSTGNTIDEGTLTGKVLLAETGKPDSTLIVVLHRNPDDSAVANKRPRYYTKLDSSGRFRFRFLAPGTYRLYALKDESGVKRYTSRSQLFAFADEPVVISDSTTSVRLYAYQLPDTSVKKPATKQVVQQEQPKKKKGEEDRRLKFQTNAGGGQDLLDDLTFTFENPLKTFDTSKLEFTDEKFVRLSGYTIKPDSTHRVYALKYPWKESTTYQVILDKEFASDSAGRKLLKNDTLTIKTKSEADYGSVRLRFTNLDLKKKPILQLTQQDKIVFAQPLTGNEFYTKLFKPGDYEIRILYDTNGNGVWDPGDFFGKHLQPEIAISIAKKMTVKANWDNEVTIEIPQ